MQIPRRRMAVALALWACGLSGCSAPSPGPGSYGSAAERLKPLEKPLPGSIARGTVYVPVYSSIYWGVDRQMADLAVTLSIRNTSLDLPLVVDFVRYYDSAGNKIRDYVSVPSALAPMATVEFVIQQADTAGGPGANFLVQWSGGAGIDEPIIEAVMVGQMGNAGISFTSPGRPVKPPGASSQK